MLSNSLYYNTQLVTSVTLRAKQMDSEMDDHLLNNLKTEVEGKTSEHGMQIRVNRLISYGYGEITKLNFMGGAVYDVVYECLVCSPTKNMEIICSLEKIVKGYLIGKNGPVIVAVQFNNIDSEYFEKSGNKITHKKSGREIIPGDYLKVAVIGKKDSKNDGEIMTICKLIDFATDDDIGRFNQEQILIKGDGFDEPVEFI